MSSVLERLRAALAPEYDVEREIASGGMGMVFLGRHGTGVPVAIKVLRPELATAHAAERFLREARMLASLRHPHIVPVHHVGQAGEFFYYVMDFVDGETLADRLVRGPLRPQEALKLGRDLLDALQVAHERLVVHRDMPSNVFFAGGRALLVDFGIAKPVSGTSGGAVTPRGRAPTAGRRSPRPVRSWGRWITCHPSKRRVRRSHRGPICTPSHGAVRGAYRATLVDPGSP